MARYKFNVEKAKAKIIAGLRESNPSKKAVIGISGGKDSTCVAYTAVAAYGKENVLGVLMPNHDQADIQDSIRVCEELGIEYVIVNIGEMYDALRKAVPFEKTYQAETNSPARLRMVTLFDIAACHGGRVLNTCNKSEDCLGFSTFYGDSAGSYGPLCDYTVTEVRQIGIALGAPKDLMLKAPSDGMCGSTDEQNLAKQLNIAGFTYERFDKLVRKQKHDFTKDEVKRIIDLYKKMKFKLDIIQMPHPKSGYPDFFKRVK